MTPKNRTKTVAETAADPVPRVGTLIPQLHGGSLLAGGQPGNKGGTGRPRSVIRDACAGDFDRRRKVLRAIADDTEAKDRDRIAAVDVLGKYGLGPATASDDPLSGGPSPGITIVYANVLLRRE